MADTSTKHFPTTTPCPDCKFVVDRLVTTFRWDQGDSETVSLVCQRPCGWSKAISG